tara:strand:- start:268 stop:957 length:690 start_codon:yes stop_codon:yes gene_type:complete
MSSEIHITDNITNQDAILVYSSNTDSFVVDNQQLLLPDNFDSLPPNFREAAIRIARNTSRLEDLMTQEALQASLLQSNTVKTKSVMKNNDITNILKKTKFKNTINSNTECPITNNTFNPNDVIIILPCNHSFEPYSILNWLQNHNSECPMCRHKLKGTIVSYNTKIDINTNIIPITLSNGELEASKYKISKKPIVNIKNSLHNKYPNNVGFMNTFNTRRKRPSMMLQLR